MTPQASPRRPENLAFVFQELLTVGEMRKSSERLADVGLDLLTDHYAKIAGSFDIAPVIIGHSVGGLIACANTPRSSASSQARTVTSGSPSTSGMIWVRAPATSKPSAARP